MNPIRHARRFAAALAGLAAALAGAADPPAFAAAAPAALARPGPPRSWQRAHAVLASVAAAGGASTRRRHAGTTCTMWRITGQFRSPAAPS